MAGQIAVHHLPREEFHLAKNHVFLNDFPSFVAGKNDSLEASSLQKPSLFTWVTGSFLDNFPGKPAKVFVCDCFFDDAMILGIPHDWNDNIFSTSNSRSTTTKLDDRRAVTQ